MPTPRGWALAVGSAVAGAGGRALGLRELYVVAASGLALALGAVAWVWLRRFSVGARRLLLPTRLAVGDVCRVELDLTNDSRLHSPALGLADGPGGQYLLAPLAPAETARATYGIEATRRGVRPVGPLRLRLEDPFGLASRTVNALDPGSLIVHPRVDSVPPPPEPPASTALGGPRRPTISPLAGEDFHALRPYEPGDDLRLVHWPTSARRDELVVRQDELPRIHQTTVAVDLRASVHDRNSLELAVSAAASVAVASARDDGLVRLVTTGGADSGSSGGEVHVESMLDLLALADMQQPKPAPVGSHDEGGPAVRSDNLGSLARVLGDGDGGTLVVVTTVALAVADFEALIRIRRQWPMVVLVMFQAVGANPPPRSRQVAVDVVVPVGLGEGFAPAWSSAMSRLMADA